MKLCHSLRGLKSGRLADCWNLAGWPRHSQEKAEGSIKIGVMSERERQISGGREGGRRLPDPQSGVQSLEPRRCAQFWERKPVCQCVMVGVQLILMPENWGIQAPMRLD